MKGSTILLNNITGEISESMYKEAIIDIIDSMLEYAKECQETIAVKPTTICSHNVYILYDYNMKDDSPFYINNLEKRVYNYLNEYYGC